MGSYITKLLLCASHSARRFTPIMYYFSRDLFLVGITQNLQRSKWDSRRLNYLNRVTVEVPRLEVQSSDSKSHAPLEHTPSMAPQSRNQP